jgi:tetratricopeptide (TPR) repeat protein
MRRMFIMADIKCRRFDIFLADLKRFGIKEPHYIICLSNWKNNIKSPEINSCMITSKIKKHPAHVTFEGFGLEKSQIKCEKILTVLKQELIKKVGNITDMGLQMEIEKCLQMQLQLSENYIKTDIEQLEQYLVGSIRTMNNNAVYNKLKEEIFNLAYEDKYEECLMTCNKLIESVLNSNVSNKLNYLWNGYYHRALMYVKLGHLDLALADAKESLKFVGDIRGEINNRYSYSMWMLANVYEKINKNKSIEIYTILSKYYKNMGRTNLRIAMLFNIAKLNKNINRMNTLIQIIEHTDFTEFETEKSKKELLRQSHTDLCELTNAIS